MSTKSRAVSSAPPKEVNALTHTVLVVDDDDRIVEAFAHILGQDGHRILSASTGTEAWKIVQTQTVALVVCDVYLPDVSGIDTCRRIKSQLNGIYLPVILMTGLTTRDMRLEGLNAGADDFLDKPIELVELKARVRAHLRTKRLHDEVEAHRRELEVRVEERTVELRQAYDRLQTLSKAKGNILSIVAHELRTPLLHARSSLDLAVQEGVGEHERTDLIHAASNAMLELEYRIGDVEVLNDPSDLRLAGASIHAMSTRAVDQAIRHHPAAAARVTMEVPKDLPAVHVDNRSIVRVLVHLLENAIKFGGDSPVRLQAEQVNDGIRVVVSDEGPGLSKDVQETMFEPLQPGDVSLTRQHRGMGIGLALVKVVLEAHDVNLIVETGDKEGTSLEFVLPVFEGETDH